MTVDCRTNPLTAPGGSGAIDKLWFRVSRWLTYEYLRRFENPATLLTRQGLFRVPIGVKDPISRELFLSGEFELDLIKEAMQLVRERSGRPKGTGTLIDIGANNGVISIGMLVTGELDSAVAIEPEPGNFSRLCENVALNRLDDSVLLLQRALSRTPATLTFELSESNYGDHRVRMTSSQPGQRENFKESERPVITVPSDTLDDMIAGLAARFREDIAVIWIDVQGYEGHVFAGGRKVLARDIPVVSEVWPYGITRAGMTLDEFARLATEIWGAFTVKRRGRWVKYPIVAFRAFLDELVPDNSYDNVMFTRD